MIKECGAKSPETLSQEWSLLAEERHRQIVSGEDVSFHHVLVPTAFALLQSADMDAVWDIGCGTGEFSALLAAQAKRVVAVDPSTKSIALSRTVCGARGNVEFVRATLEDSLDNRVGAATTAVALMTLMTVPDLTTFATCVSKLLTTNGSLVALITHPCFWPRYWGYESAPWFSYDREIFIEAPFVISRCRTQFITTHVHRPVSTYLRVFADAGFRLTACEEPMPSAEIQALYPRRWDFPRFLGLRWQRIAVDC